MERERCFNLGGLEACSTIKFFKIRSSEIPCSAFFPVLLQQINTKENTVVSCLFYQSLVRSSVKYGVRKERGKQVNPLSPKSDQHQISPSNINAL